MLTWSPEDQNKIQIQSSKSCALFHKVTNLTVLKSTYNLEFKYMDGWKSYIQLHY